MKKFSITSLCLTISLFIVAQKRTIPVDTTIQTTHQTTVNGTSFSYTATTGMQPVWNKKNEVEASLFYTYYTRNNIKDRSKRPLLISFNGGPGSASVWMHMAYTGPKILNIDEEGYPLQPYGYKDNPYSVLDVADIVFVNPVNTGYSRLIHPDAKKEDFFGINADIAYLAKWINTFVSRNNRWASPKFLIGESYGTTRVSGLALALQNSQWMYLNGVILVSPTGLGIQRNGPVDVANRLPYFAAAAWYHKKLSPTLNKMPLNSLLEEVEDYTIQNLIPVLAKGGFATQEDRKIAAEQMAKYSGLNSEVILDYNLDVPLPFFWKELLRSERKTIGRLDSRYLGIDKVNHGVRPDYNAELTSWLHSFTPAINDYLRNNLGFKTDLKYNMFGPVRPWNSDNNRTGENLRLAMAENPYLKVMVQSGYFDGATTYFNAKYTMWHIDPSGVMRDRLRFEGYESGHMMYLRKEDLESSNAHLRSFILNAIPDEKTPAKYE